MFVYLTLYLARDSAKEMQLFYYNSVADLKENQGPWSTL